MQVKRIFSKLLIALMLITIPLRVASQSNEEGCVKREFSEGTTIEEQSAALRDLSTGWERNHPDVYTKRAKRSGSVCAVKVGQHLLLRNLDRVSLNVFRGAQPLMRDASKPTGEDGFTLLRAAGFTDIIDLRQSKNQKESAQDRVRLEEKRVVEEGLKFYAIELPSLNFGIPLLSGKFSEHVSDVARAVRLMRALETQPDRKIFIHCSHGADRTGVVVAMSRLLDGAPLITVLDEADDHSFSRFQRGMRRFIQTYAQPERLAEFRRLVEESQP
jgi:hypothetical protein